MNLDNSSHPGQESSGFSCTAAITQASFELVGNPAAQLAMCAVSVPVCLAITLANLIVITSVLRTPSLHTPSNVLLLGLALSDCGVGFVSLPAFMVELAAKAQQEAVLFCKASQVAWTTGWLLCSVSLLTLTAVSLDRYVAIHFHLRYHELVTKTRVLTVLTVIWFVGAMIAVLYGLNVSSFNAITTSLLFVEFAVMVFVSCSIHRVVRRHQKAIAAQMCLASRNEDPSRVNLPLFRRSFLNMQLLCLCLLLCYLPFMIMTQVILAAGLTPAKQSALEFSILMVCLNSALNPLLYCWCCQPIRDAMKILVRDLLCKSSQ